VNEPMSDERDERTNDPRDKASPKRDEKELTFLRCSKHGRSYPKGEECPSCLNER
jgi:uncharacterized OB-fold protein